MSQPVDQKAYLHTLPRTWWLKRWAYTRFMIREITAVFVALYIVELVIMISTLSHGGEPSPQATAEFFETLKAPHWVAFHVISLLFVVYHSITWFNLSPKVFVVYMFEEKIPAWLVAGSNYVGWAALSVIVAWYLLRT